MSETIDIQTSKYPSLLRQIHQPPPQLFTRGSLSVFEKPCVAVVGTRKMTLYGKTVLEEIIPELCEHATIVSGLAFGVDAYAHELTVRHHGLAIAVLGGGVDNETISPRTNISLAQRIIDHDGMILSEYPDKTKPEPYHFSARNRIIAGLSLLTIVIEAPEKSGSLITARHALECNREVCAIPGNIDQPYSRGANDLIKQGAHVITRVEDIIAILAEINHTNATPKKTIQKIPYQPIDENEKLILDAIKNSPCSVDKLIEQLPIHTNQINTTLSLLEIQGIITIDHLTISLK